MDLKIDIPENINIQDLFGNYDSNVRTVEKLTGTAMTVRDNQLIIAGSKAEQAEVNALVEKYMPNVKRK